MFSGIDPRMMRQAMKKMGMAQEELVATEVVIKLADKELVITEPSVVKVSMGGQESFQISGEVHERERGSELQIAEDDITTVMEQAKVSRAQAEAALKNTKGDIAEAILNLQ